MLRWFLGGRDAQSSVEVSSFLTTDFIFGFKIILFITNTILALTISTNNENVTMKMWKGRFFLKRVIWNYSSFVCNFRDFILFVGAVIWQ